MAVVDQIFIASGARLPMQPVQTVIVTETGLEGDRYAIRKGSFSGQRHDLRDVTLISLDDIRESNAILSVPFTPAETRRNIVVAGSISLLDFVGREFAVGPVKLRGIEEAAPCRHPEKIAKKSGFSRAFKRRAGIRANVVEVGRINVGDEVRLLSPGTVAAQDGPARQREWRGGEALRNARTCYDHMAGRIGVRIADCLVGRSHVMLDEDGGTMTEAGLAFLEGIGIDLSFGSKRRVFCRPCLDWSERRPHLAGVVGACLLNHALAHDWVRRTRDSRALSITPVGRRGFFETYGYEPGA